MPPNDRPLHPGSACLPCRKRKAKCDGVRPVCARCKRLGSNCQFDPPNRHSQARAASTDSATLSSPPRELSSPRTISPRSGLVGFQHLRDKLPDDARLDRIIASFARPSLPIYLYRESWENPLENGRITRTLYPEAYETCIPRATIEAAIHNWDVRYDPPPDVADYLVRLFLPFRRQFYFYMDIQRLLRRTHVSPSDPEAVHPALLSAIYLIVCHLVKGELRPYEPILLARARAYMEQSLTHADRLTHFLGASLILSCWYEQTGRLVEAQNSIATTVQFAVACGLHDPNGNTANAMLPPADEIELIDRRNLWYGITMCDNCLSYGNGTPRMAPEKSISSLDYLVNESLNDMFQFPSAVQIRNGTGALMCAVRQFVEESKIYPRTSALINRGIQLSQILGTFANILPPIDSADGLAIAETISLANPDFINAHIDIYGATMIITNARLDEEPMAYERIFKSACAIANLGKHLRSGGRLELIHAAPSNMLAFRTACEVLIRDLIRNSGNTSPEAAQRAAATEQNLDQLLTFVTETAVHFPSRRWSLQKIRGILSGTDKFETI